mmetsp:Transcript_32385/g.111523  ORF Transcript_32385/g.111523 Transcript_32385/m.111523 type:complete len:1484 (+) Transcript_32385:3-4454(+)
MDDARVFDMDKRRCLHAHVHEEGAWAREAGIYLLRGLESAMLSFDFSHIPGEMIYNEHWRLAVFVRPSRCDEELCDGSRTLLGPQEQYPCRRPLELPKWFNSSTTPKNLQFNMTVFALDDVIFKVEVQLLHGMWLPIKSFLENTATVQIMTPLRAKMLNEYSQNLLREQQRLRKREEKKTNLNFGSVAADFERQLVGADALRRKLSPYVSFEERDTDKFYIMGVVIDGYEPSVELPLNLPPRYADYERGRVLVSFNSTLESQPDVPDTYDDPAPKRELEASYFLPMQPPYSVYKPIGDSSDISDSADAAHDVYFETFWFTDPAELTGKDKKDVLKYMGAQNERFLLLPYLPYFSHCREFDSYIPFAQLVESDQCALPPQETMMSAIPADPGVFAPYRRYQFGALPHVDDIAAVKAPDILRLAEVPVADWCERTVDCAYEEGYKEGASNPLWFHAEDGTELFNFLKRPISYLEYVGRDAERVSQGGMDHGGGKIVYERYKNRDELISVSVANGNGDCVALGGCRPTKMVLEIGYKQIVSSTWKEKNIIYSTLHFVAFSGSDAASLEDKAYELTVVYMPLGYIDLIIQFAHEMKVFIGIFFATGGITCSVSAIMWLLVRITTTLENPPRIRVWNMLLLIAAPPASGVSLGLVPVTLTLFLVVLFIRYVDSKYIFLAIVPGETIEYLTSTSDPGVLVERVGGWVFTLFGQCPSTPKCVSPKNELPVQWSDDVPNATEALGARRGRMGVAFMVIAAYSWGCGCLMFLPDRASRRDKELQKRRDKGAEKEEIWHPTMWRRSNLCFCSFMIGLLGTVIIEFSYWDSFGTYIWYIVVGFRPLGIFVGTIVDNQLQEALLSAPIMTALDVVTGIVTLSADDFIDFILSYFIELGLGLTEMIYFDPGLGAFLEWWYNFVSGLRARIVAKLPKWVAGRAADVAEKTEEQTSFAKRELEGAIAEGGETVEPILDSFGAYSTKAMTLLYNVFLLVLLTYFRDEVYMTDNYGIKSQEMLYFLIFAVIIIPFQFLADVLSLSVLELFYGWKIYDYLIYTRYRFLQRETRWKGLEDSLDECIDESVRTLDQMCFSSQYYMMLTVHVNGIIMFVLGGQMIMQSQYNFFGDRLLIFVVLISYLSCYAVEWFVLKVAIRVNLWRVKHENTAWHTALQETDEFDIPGWEDLQGASHDSFMMNQRITSETFRFKFLNYNRSWLIQQLPSILTPRTLRRSRPYLLNQFMRILNQLNDTISSDSDSEADKFGPVALTAPSRQIIRWWLAEARRRMRLREVVQPLITKARGTQCEICLSRKQLQVEVVIPLEELAAKYDVEHPAAEFDQVAWKTFWIKNQKYRTVCLNCVTRQKMEDRGEAARGGRGDVSDDEGDDYPDWGPVFVSDASRAILLNWHRQAQKRLFGGAGGRKRAKAKLLQPLDLSDDDEADNVPQFKAAKDLNFSPAAKAIAVRWLRTARATLQKQGGSNAAPRRKRPGKGTKKHK